MNFFVASRELWPFLGITMAVKSIVIYWSELGAGKRSLWHRAQDFFK